MILIAMPVKFFIDNWFLFAIAAASGGLLLWPLLTKSSLRGTKVSTQAAVQLINRQKAVMIDVSEPAQYAAAHAAGAKNVPLADLRSSKQLPKNKALPLVVVCHNGTRSSRAVAVLHKLGFENTHVLVGGLTAWRAANLPVEKTA
jgi:rhodanese-related sulfurtransferase